MRGPGCWSRLEHGGVPGRAALPPGRALGAAVAVFFLLNTVAVAQNAARRGIALVMPGGGTAHRVADEVAGAVRSERYGKLPLRFEPNLGQSSREVKFLGRGAGYTVFLTPTAAVLVLEKMLAGSGPRSAQENSKLETRRPFRIAPRVACERAVLSMRLVGGNPRSRTIGLQELPGKSNYIIGRKPSQWRAHVPNFARVLYEEVYPGVDLVFYGDKRGLEFDFMVAPGADPKAIRLAIETGSSKIENPKLGMAVDANGDLVISTSTGEVRLHKPVVYQVQPSVVSDQRPDAGDDAPRTTDNSQSPIDSRQFLEGSYVLRPGRPHNHQSSIGNHQFEVAFEIASYDPAKPLVIDPVMSYSTYLGGSGLDYAYGIAVDSLGSAYVAGYTNSADFSVDGATQGALGGGTCGSGLDIYPCYDVFVAKLNAAGTALVYSTYIGGSGEDYGVGIAIDASGSAFVAGYTNSRDFPVANAAQADPAGAYDAFVTKLAPDGSALLYSSHLGGSGEDYGYGVAVGSGGDTYVTGFTSSMDFPVTSGAVQGAYGGAAYDAFVSRLDITSPALVYSTFLGGSREDYGADIALDPSGDAFVTGYTNSGDFPATNGFQQAYAGGTCGAGLSTYPCFDAFVSKLNAEGVALVYSTYLGGRDGDYGYGIALDAQGSAYATGLTTSADFPVTEGALQTAAGATVDAFVAKLNPAGDSAVYATYLGGIGAEAGLDIAVDGAGNSYVVGYTYGSGFPLASPLEPASGGYFDAFLAKLNTAGTALVFSTYLGGNGDEGAHGIVLDSSGSAYVAGGTFSTNFPVTASAFQPAYGGGSYEAFVTKLANLTLPVVTPRELSVNFSDQGVGTTSPAETVTLGNSGDAELALAGASVSGDFALASYCAATLPPEGHCALEITFSPTEMGPRTGSVTIEHMAYGSPFRVNLTGKGVAAPSVALSTTSLAFLGQALATTSPTQAVTLGNVGRAVLNVAGITATGDFAQTNTCGASLPVGTTCDVAVTFTPTVPGILVGAITITDNAPGSPHVVSLSGTGLGAAADFSPPSLVFDPQLVGTSSVPAAVTLTNGGNLPLEISSITATGDFTQSNSCGTRVEPGAGCAIHVTFTPSARGGRAGTLAVVDNALGSPHEIALSGRGIIAGTAGLDPTSLVFGEQLVGTFSEAQMVRMTNPGDLALAITGVEVSGDFAQTNTCEASLGAGATCSFSVRFQPTATGARSGLLSISFEGSGSPATVNLMGTGVAPVVTLSPPELSFGEQPVGTTSDPQTLTLANTGNAPLSLAGIGASGDFAQTNGCGTTVPVGGECAIDITFTPSQAGSRSGNVLITHNPTLESFTVPLLGMGTDFSVSASPTKAMISAGKSASYTLTLAFIGAFKEQIGLSCRGAPKTSTCSISPALVTPNGASSATATVTVATTARTIGPVVAGRRGKFTPALGRAVEFATSLLGFLFMAYLGVKPRRRAWIGVVAACLLVVTWCACGGGGAGITPRPAGGTPPGTYTLTLTAASDSLSRSTSVALTVN